MPTILPEDLFAEQPTNKLGSLASLLGPQINSTIVDEVPDYNPQTLPRPITPFPDVTSQYGLGPEQMFFEFLPLFAGGETSELEDGTSAGPTTGTASDFHDAGEGRGDNSPNAGEWKGDLAGFFRGPLSMAASLLGGPIGFPSMIKTARDIQNNPGKYGISAPSTPSQALTERSDWGISATGGGGTSSSSSEAGSTGPGSGQGNPAGPGGFSGGGPGGVGTGEADGGESDGGGGAGPGGGQGGGPSGNHHSGGMITDQNPKTYKDKMEIEAQEGEYIMTRAAVGLLGEDFFKTINRYAKN